MNDTKIIEENDKKNPEAEQTRHGIIKIKRDTLKWIIIGLAAFFVLILVFGLGMFVGATKARFSYRWAENYHQNFGGPGGGFMNDWRMLPPNNEFIEGHGTFGEIIEIENSELVITGKDNVERLILIKDDTSIMAGREKVEKDELKVNDYIIVIGSPNDAGQIEAKLIRIFKKEGAEISPRIPYKPFL